MVCRLADVIENGASRTARIVQDLKTFSHPGQEELKSFDLHDVLEMSLNLIRSELKNRITVHKDYNQMDAIHGPPGQLSQVFLNILNNAQQAMPDGGEIFITTRKADDHVSVRIRDTGTGMAEDARRRIFDPFFTTKEPGVGTGLGMSISYGIVSSLGGSIECESRVGVGTEFTVSLPCQPRPQHAHPPIQEDREGLASTPEMTV
jgi:signal transduction histidine kinase